MNPSERKHWFLMLVQTDCITRDIQDNRTLGASVLASAMKLRIPDDLTIDEIAERACVWVGLQYGDTRAGDRPEWADDLVNPVSSPDSEDTGA